MGGLFDKEQLVRNMIAIIRSLGLEEDVLKILTRK